MERQKVSICGGQKTISNLVKTIIDATFCKDHTYFRKEVSEFFSNHVLKNTRDDCSIATMSIHKDDCDFFKSLTPLEAKRMFTIDENSYQERGFLDEYISTLIYGNRTSSLKHLSRILNMRPRTLKRRIKKLRSLLQSNEEVPLELRVMGWPRPI